MGSKARSKGSTILNILPEQNIRIRRVDWLAMQSHVQKTHPDEACGLVAGVRGRSKAVYPVENILHSPNSFRMEARAQLEAMLDIEAKGWDLLAIYHSHPRGGSTPSKDDRMEHYPDCAILIWSPINETWGCQAYILDHQGSAVEIPVNLLYK